MRQYFLGLLILFFTSLNTPVLAGWTEVENNDKGDKFYVDFERLRKFDGMSYFWQLSDYGKVSKFGDLSALNYYQGDCRLFRYKILQFQTFDGRMGNGNNTADMRPSRGWEFPNPDSIMEDVLGAVCRK